MGHQSVTSSGLKTSSVAIVALPALLYGVQIVPAAADTTIVVYDNASAGSGTVLFKHFIPVSTSASSQAIVLDNPIIANNGLYLSITGTDAGAIVHYGNMVFKQEKRSQPAITIYNPNTGATGTGRATNSTSPAVSSPGSPGGGILVWP